MSNIHSAARSTNMIGLRLAARLVALLAALSFLTSTSVVAQGCDLIDLTSAVNTTAAAKSDFDRLNSCFKDLQARLAAAEARLSALEGQVGNIQVAYCVVPGPPKCGIQP